jgi:hypothetical protein
VNQIKIKQQQASDKPKACAGVGTITWAGVKKLVKINSSQIQGSENKKKPKKKKKNQTENFKEICTV